MSENRSILRIAIPNILSNISVPLLGTVDTALMGRLSELHIGAVGIGGMIFSFMYWNFGFLRMGTTGITARAFGAERLTEVSATLGRALVIALLLAFGIMIFQSPLGKAGFFLMNLEGEAKVLTAQYFYIRMWAAPATLGLYALLGWFFGMQNAIYPLILTIIINVTNMIGSYWFIVQWGMEIDGVAWGTVIAQYVGFFLGVVLLFYKYPKYLYLLKVEMLLEVSSLTSFFRINRDLFFRTLALTLAFGFFYSRSAAEGGLLLAVNVILLQYLNWMSYGIDGFAYAAESLVGKYSGARKLEQLKQIIHLSFWWGGGLAVFFSVVYFIFGNQLLGIFTNQEEVITAAQPYLAWMILFPVVSFACYIWDGIFIGLTASAEMRNAMVVSLLLYLGMHYGFSYWWAVHGMWAAFLAFMALRAIFLWTSYRKMGLEELLAPNN